MNRDFIQRNMKAMRDAAPDASELPDDTPPEDFEIGVPESEITTAIDVTRWLDRKRASMRAHASQISEQSFFLVMPDEAFAMAFGTEWFIHRGVEPQQPWEDHII